MGKIKVAMIGCGARARAHLKGLITFDDIELVGFCDIVEEKAKDFVERAGTGKSYTNLREMLDDAKPQAVIIAVPPHEHGEIEFEIIERGIHFLIEKPMALQYDLAEKICKMAEEKGIITSVGFQDRYQDITEKTLEFVKDRTVAHIDGSWVGKLPTVWWWRKFETSGGQIVEQNIHIFDMLRQLFGEAESVYCLKHRGMIDPVARDVEGFNVDDFTTVLIKMKNGAIASIKTGCYPLEGCTVPNGMDIYCEDATVHYNLRKTVTLKDKNGEETYTRNSNQNELIDRGFIDAVKTGDTSTIRSPYSDALKTLRLCMACQESADTGRIVYLD